MYLALVFKAMVSTLYYLKRNIGVAVTVAYYVTGRNDIVKASVNNKGRLQKCFIRKVFSAVQIL